MSNADNASYVKSLVDVAVNLRHVIYYNLPEQAWDCDDLPIDMSQLVDAANRLGVVLHQLQVSLRPAPSTEP